MRTYIIAAFAEEAFRGNPAGVCILENEVDEPQLQGMARELNQPQTAFVRKVGAQWVIRWFSPMVEVDLCGHATLAASFVLWHEGLVERSDPITFSTSSSLLLARLDQQGRVWLSLPILPGEIESAPADVLACINLVPRLAARHGTRWLLEFASAAQVRALQPDFEALARTGVRSLIVTAPSDMPGYQIVSRNFAPIVGVNEDQVTGTAHTCLAAHWGPRLGSEIRCWQASGRGGGLIVRSVGNQVELGGNAVLEFAGAWVPSRAFADVRGTL